jgi:hypothetical protein
MRSMKGAVMNTIIVAPNAQLLRRVDFRPAADEPATPAPAPAAV